MDYVERQNEWLKNSGVKEGDKVLVVSGLPEWTDTGQLATVGMIGVVGYSNADGVLVRFGRECPCADPDCGYGWQYPFYLLTKVEDE